MPQTIRMGLAVASAVMVVILALALVSEVTKPVNDLEGTPTSYSD